MVHVWIYFLLKANYQDGKWHGIDVPRGSLITSIDTICKDTGLSRQSVRTCISKLKSTHEITITSTHKYSVINICKYDKYNINIDFTNTQPNTQPNQQLTQFQHSANTVPTLLKEDNKDNNNNKETKEEELTYVSKKKRTFVPPTVEEVTEYIKEKKLHFDADKFVDFYESKGWYIGKNKMKDWKAACRTWEGKRKEGAKDPQSREDIGVILHGNNTGKYDNMDLW